jgi:hypothetical protein
VAVLLGWRTPTRIFFYVVLRPALDEVLGGEFVLEASIRGTVRDGGPACASVPLASTWCPRPM